MSADPTPILPYHREIVAYLKAQETELWKWFSSMAFLEEYAATTRLDLLKACYRFEPAENADLYSVVGEVRERLGLEAPVTLYQAQDASSMNASLCYVPREAHLVFAGPIRATLTPEELRAIVAHELTHYLLWERHDGDLLVADQMLAAMSIHPRAEPSHIEAARLFRMYLEVHCDRAALAVCADPLVAISALVKVQTGLADVHAESYLRQSEEIFGQAEVQTEGLTHPESFIRARALKLWADGGENAEGEIARMIEGALDLNRLGLLGQARLTAWTRRMLVQFLEPAWIRTEPLLAHARLFFPDLDPDRPEPEASIAKEDVARASESVKKYLAYILLDLATVDGSLEEAPLAAALRLGEEMGIADLVGTLAGEELDLGKRALTRLKKDAAKILAAAERRPEA